MVLPESGLGCASLLGDHERQAEFGFQLLGPLRHQVRRDQHEYPLGQASQQVFAHQEAGFDGLPQADFIGKQHTTAELAQYPAHRLYLMRQLLHALETVEAEELIVPAQQPQACRFQAQIDTHGIGKPRDTGRAGHGHRHAQSIGGGTGTRTPGIDEPAHAPSTASARRSRWADACRWRALSRW